MIIDCVSDLHGYFPALEGGDLLIVAGDLTARDTQDEYLLFGKWFHQQNYKKKVVIAGNHDNFLAAGRWKLCSPKEYGWNFEYLEDSSTEFEGLRIWGSPWTKTFEGMNPKCMAFTKKTDLKLLEKWQMIPLTIDILITHSPPFGMMDLVSCDRTDENGMVYGEREYVGSKTLTDRLIQLPFLKLHVFGHIHESYGECHQGYLMKDFEGKEFVPMGHLSVNASHVDEHYKPVNKPIRVIL